MHCFVYHAGNAREDKKKSCQMSSGHHGQGRDSVPETMRSRSAVGPESLWTQVVVKDVMSQLAYLVVDR